MSLESMTRDQLRAEAKSRGIKGYSSLTKAELLERLGSMPVETGAAPVPPSEPDPILVESVVDPLFADCVRKCVHQYPPGAVRDQAVSAFYAEVNRTQGKGRTRKLRRLLSDAGLRHEASVAA